ncbi:MAG: protein O-mannosyl-transferase family [Vicinamibacterales bacterium]
MTRPFVAALAFVFALAHLPYLPSALEDIDSVNFALGIRDFDVADHRPHPPGYPAYIGLGKVAVALARPFAAGRPASGVEARTLGLLSLMAGALALLALYRVFAAWGPSRQGRMEQPWSTLQPRALAATALTAACPLFWYMAARPMSDMPGLAIATAAQACLALAWWRQRPGDDGDRRLDRESTAASGRMIVLGALLMGVALGFRTQTAWLTAPLLIAVLFDRIGRGVAGAMLGSAMTFAIGATVWAVPLIAASGGIGPYWAALGSQAGEDFAGVEMLYSNPTPRLLAFGLLRTFIYPWDSVVLGGVILSLAAVGIIGLLLRERRALAVVAITSVPYLVFHLLFQDTTFVRYALPLVPSVSFLATSGAAFVAEAAVLPAAGALSLWAVAIAAPVMAAYGSRPSPTARALGEMRLATLDSRPGALGMHQTFRRPLQAEDVPVHPQLASPPRREWLEAVEYWRQGRTRPLWFLADPRRSDLALIDPASRRDHVAFRWDYESLSSVGGMRPGDVLWYRMAAPGWFAGEGWSLTPETAGIARLMGKGPHLGGAHGWVRRRHDAGRMLVGGRNLSAAATAIAHFAATIDGRIVAEWESPPGFFLHVFDLPASAFGAGAGLGELVLRSNATAGDLVIPTAIEQFDVQSVGVPVWGFSEGWHEAEYNPLVGLWHWMSDRATLIVTGTVSPLQLVMRVESPRRYFDGASTVQVRAGSRTLTSETIGADHLISVTIPADALQEAKGVVTIETDQTFVPAERNAVADRRRLGLRVFDVDLRPLSQVR